ncbi:MAG: endonuclease [Pseudomonadota bacterium]
MLLRILQFVFAIIAGLAAVVAFQHLRLSTASPPPDKPEGAIRIASYNVHYIVLFQGEGRWGLSGWEERKGPMDTVFKALDADIIAFQEMESFWRGSDGSINLARDWLLENNPGYAAAAMGDWRAFPGTQPIFYRPERFGVRDQGWWFFSEEPDRIYSRGFDGASPSFASWVQFEDRDSGALFRVVSVHFDAFSRTNRNGAAALTASRVAPWIEAGETVILAGDLNALSGSRIHATLERVGLTFPRVPHASFHLNRGLHLFGAIDHFGLSGTAQAVARPFVLQMRPDGVWPTDHHPVGIDLNIDPSVPDG